MARLLLVLALVPLSAPAATLAPEVPLSPPAITAAPFAQHLLGVASNGRDFLAIWADYRSTIPVLPDWASTCSIYVSRLDENGKPMNPFGVKLLDRACNAAIVHTDAGYTLLWSDRNGTHMMLLDDNGRQASTPKNIQGSFAVAASNGHTIFFVGPDALVLSLDGQTLSHTSMTASDHLVRAMRPMVMPNGDYGFIDQVWTCPGNVPCTVSATLITVSPSGAIAGSNPLQDLSQSSQSTAAIGNGRLLLAWLSDAEKAPLRTINFRVFDLDGRPTTDAKTIAGRNDAASISGYFGPSVGWDGQNFLLAWQWPAGNDQSGEIDAVRIGTDGTVIDSNPLVLSPTLGGLPWFASNGRSQLVAWDSYIGQSADIDVRVSPSFDELNATSTTVMPQSAALQRDVSLASRGADALVVWREGELQPQIETAIVGQTPLTIATANATSDVQAPAATASSSQYLVVWREQSAKAFRILGKRIAADGTAIDRDPIVIGNEAANPFPWWGNTIAVACDGTDFFVAWGAAGDLLVSARVGAAGVVLDTTPVVLSSWQNGEPESPRAIWNGSTYVLAWSGDYGCKSCLSPISLVWAQIFVTRVGRDGKPIDSMQIWSANAYGAQVSIANGGPTSMVVWALDDASCVYQMSLGATGAPASAVQTLRCGESQITDLDIAWDGGTFATAWTATSPTESTATAKAIRTSSAGTPLEDPFEIAPSGPSFQPHLAAAPNGVIVTYGRIANEPEYGGVSRVFARLLDRFSAVPRRRVVRY